MKTRCICVVALFVCLAGGAVGCAPQRESGVACLAGPVRTFLLDGRDDRPIAYRDNQRTDAKLTLLFVHGLSSSMGSWHFVAPAFDDEYRVVLVDLVGHGDSCKPELFDYSMSGQGGMLRALIRGLALKNVVIVGSSYGGGAALEAALPWCGESRCAPIRGIVLLDPAAVAFKPPGEYALIEWPLARWLLKWTMSPRALARRLLQESFVRDARIPAVLLAERTRVLSDPGGA